MASEKEKFAARLNQVLDEAGFPGIGQGRQSAVAKLVDVSPQQAGRWLKGEDFPKTSTLVKLAQHLNVRSNWLLSGAGAKSASEAEDELAREQVAEEGAGIADRSDPAPENGLSKEAFEVALAWMKLSPRERLVLRKIIVELGESA